MARVASARSAKSRAPTVSHRAGQPACSTTPALDPAPSSRPRPVQALWQAWHLQQRPLVPLAWARLARPFSLAQTTSFLAGGAWLVSRLAAQVEPWGLGDGTALIICTSIASRACPKPLHPPAHNSWHVRRPGALSSGLLSAHQPPQCTCTSSARCPAGRVQPLPHMSSTPGLPTHDPSHACKSARPCLTLPGGPGYLETLGPRLQAASAAAPPWWAVACAAGGLLALLSFAMAVSGAELRNPLNFWHKLSAAVRWPGPLSLEPSCLGGSAWAGAACARVAGWRRRLRMLGALLCRFAGAAEACSWGQAAELWSCLLWGRSVR